MQLDDNENDYCQQQGIIKTDTIKEGQTHKHLSDGVTTVGALVNPQLEETHLSTTINNTKSLLLDVQTGTTKANNNKHVVTTKHGSNEKHHNKISISSDVSSIDMSNNEEDKKDKNKSSIEETKSEDITDTKGHHDEPESKVTDDSPKNCHKEKEKEIKSKSDDESSNMMLSSLFGGNSDSILKEETKGLGKGGADAEFHIFSKRSKPHVGEIDSLDMEKLKSGSNQVDAIANII